MSPVQIPEARTDPATAGPIPRALAVDRTSPIPLWYQVARGLQELIEGGTVAPGSHLDNEILLSRQLKLSRPTVRRAMEHLVDQGLIVRQRGVGTRVVQQKVRRPMALTSLYDDLRAGGQEPTTTVLAHDLVGADTAVALALEVPVDTEVLRIERLRSAAGNPVARLTNYLPRTVEGLSATALESGGLYELLRAQGIVLHAATQTVGARRASAAEARLLEETRGAALLTMRRTTFDDHGRPVEYGQHIYAATRYVFQTQLVAPF